MKNKSAYLLGAIAFFFVVSYLIFAPKTPIENPSERIVSKSTNTFSSPIPVNTATTPTPTPTPISKKFLAGQRVWIRRNHIRLRQKPNMLGKIIREGGIGESYYLTGNSQNADHIKWLEIELNPGQTAWISKDFLMTTAPTIQKPIPTASPFVTKLHQQSAAAWSRANENEKLSVAFALSKQILKKAQKTFSDEKGRELKQCLDASTLAPDLQTLKIYELASTCAIAMNWI